MSVYRRMTLNYFVNNSGNEIFYLFTPFKMNNYFSYKDPISDHLKFSLVTKFTRASCSSSYIDKTYHHFKIRTEQHIKKDGKSNMAITF